MESDITKALEVLREGGVILFPSDTTWSLGCDATNPIAVKKITDIKKKQSAKGMLVLMENPALLDRYVADIPDIAWDLIEISNTPLTIIFQQVRNVAPELTGIDGSLAIRFTKDAFSSELIRRFRKPVLATSANFNEKPEPQNFMEVEKEIISASDYIVKFRREEKHYSIPSSVIKLGKGGRIEIVSS
jgi:L-threonylcarbamoyladenylate synthase